MEFIGLEKFNITNPSSLGLYANSLEFEAFKEIMNINHKVVQEKIDKYYEQLNNEKNEIKTTDNILMNLSLYNTKLIPILNSGLLISLVSIFEETMYSICKVYKEKLNILVSFKDIKGKESWIDKTSKYLKEKDNKNIRNDKDWEYIKFIIDIRNVHVHNGGRIIKKEILEKIHKYKFDVSEDDNYFYIDNDTLRLFQDKIVDFLNRNFK